MNSMSVQLLTSLLNDLFILCFTVQWYSICCLRQLFEGILSFEAWVVCFNSCFYAALGIAAASFFVLKSKKDTAESPTVRERPTKQYSCEAVLLLCHLMCQFAILIWSISQVPSKSEAPLPVYLNAKWRTPSPQERSTIPESNHAP